MKFNSPRGKIRMSSIGIKNLKPLGFVWETRDPFLFCVHHLDAYPKGNAEFGPAASLAGRNIGQDFTTRDGWRMYHGETVPGFPAHPHRGFETVTVVLDGFVDHSDSAGAAGRYGMGDVQWMTAGSGLQHAEMFPLLNQDRPNRMELFQIWLNLPGAKKFVRPHYKMLWAEDITCVKAQDDNGRGTQITLIAGNLDDYQTVAPAPDSWAAEQQHGVAVWIIQMESGAEWRLPTADSTAKRTLYFFEGAALRVDGNAVPANHSFELDASISCVLQAGPEPVRLLILQGRPIGEPVVQHGPFVMNTEQEIYKAYADFRNDQFGGWPWSRSDPVHPADSGRFARYADGSEEKRG
jgi:redox-sensitive bicupin YhaK (pirin superfamily)